MGSVRSVRDPCFSSWPGVSDCVTVVAVAVADGVEKKRDDDK